uniref:Actin-related protein 5 n=1 Tax=Strigamia maritima TaxID=126957 RepID=T1J7A5_STRMM
MCAMENELFTLKDTRPTADPIYPYTDKLKSPLIIDNGSYHCRAGWAAQEKPKLIFKSVMAKQRGKKDCEAQIGNDISNIEVVRWLLKTQFDRNVVTQYDVQEQIFDYVFGHLGINSHGCVDHPIVLTEAIANPNYSRQLMSELLFECYHVPSVAYGIDSVFSFHLNNPGMKGDHAMIVSCGYHTIHLLPILSGKMDLPRTKRINVGGNHVTSFMHRLLQLKYPAHFTAITLSRAEELLHNHTHIAYDYEETLRSWKDDYNGYYSKNVHCIQLPYTPLTTTTSNVEAQKERKLQQVRRLQEMNAKRREERLAADEEKLRQLLIIQELLEDDDEDAFNKALDEVGYSTNAELLIGIAQLNTRIQRTKDKMFITSTAKDDDSSQEPKPKRFLVEFDASKYADLASWIASVKQKRQELIEARMQRRQRKSDMAKRRTLASQERMKLISQLAADKKKEDNFGQNDDDWQVYKTINRDGGDTDSEEEQEKLQEMEQILREHDLEFQKEMENSQEPNFTFNLAEYYQLHLGIELVPELLFQPSMMGIEQAGIVESLGFILSKYSQEQQNKMVQNVYLTGGCALFPGFKARLERELLAIRPFQSEFCVTMAVDPVLDAWNGARNWALKSENISKFSITRAEYDEKGGEYLKEHSASNVYYPSPPPVVIPTKPSLVTTAVPTTPSTTNTTVTSPN